MSQNISVRTDSETVDQIDAAARAQDRSRNWWINQAIKAALANERAWIEQVERGIEAADAGDFATDAEVATMFRRFENGGA